MSEPKADVNHEGEVPASASPVAPGLRERRIDSVDLLRGIAMVVMILDPEVVLGL